MPGVVVKDLHTGFMTGRLFRLLLRLLKQERGKKATEKRRRRPRRANTPKPGPDGSGAHRVEGLSNSLTAIVEA